MIHNDKKLLTLSCEIVDKVWECLLLFVRAGSAKKTTIISDVIPLRVSSQIPMEPCIVVMLLVQNSHSLCFHFVTSNDFMKTMADTKM